MSSPINSSPTYLMAGQSSLATNPIITNKFLSKQEREALIQYTKHFIRKAVQIIVQSRLGDKKPTKSRVYAYNSDWVKKSVKLLTTVYFFHFLLIFLVQSKHKRYSPDNCNDQKLPRKY